MKKITKKYNRVGILMALIILVSTILTPVYSAGASSDYIKTDEFIKQLAKAVKLDVDTTSSNPYIDAAVTAGILKTDDFKSYDSYITRTDAAILLNRADEYRNGDKVGKTLYNFVLKKRISDIKKVPESKREAVANCFAKGIIKGYFNGYYHQNRAFKGSEYLLSSSAKGMISLVVNTKKRAKLSPDGELIRTTNLPKNAKRYEYILACYPNKFYEQKFDLTCTCKNSKEYKNYWAYPVDMKNMKFRNLYKTWPLKEEMNKYLYDWADLAKTYLNYLFNVNYKTVDSKWIKGLASLYSRSNIDYEKNIKDFYIKHIKENKVIVKSSIIAVEPSTFYKDNDYCMRAYVRYKITAKNINVNQNTLIYCQYPYFKNLKSGDWRTGIFNIRFDTSDGSNGDGSDFTIGILSNFVDQ